MNTKDRRNYRRNQNATLRALTKARHAVAEMDAISFGFGMLHNNIRDLRELLGVAYSMALSTRMEHWNELGAVKPSDHPAGRGTGGLAAQPTTGRTGVGTRRSAHESQPV